MFIKYNFSKIKNNILILLIFQIIAEIKIKKKIDKPDESLNFIVNFTVKN
jgi:hypothetical protein